MLTPNNVKYQTLSNLIKQGAKRPLTEQEERKIKWLCEADEETYLVFKGLFESMGAKH